MITKLFVLSLLLYSHLSFSFSFHTSSPNRLSSLSRHPRALVDPIPICTPAQRLLIHDHLLSIASISRWARDVAHNRPIDELDPRRRRFFIRYFGSLHVIVRASVLQRFVNLQLEAERTVDWSGAEQGHQGEGNVVVTCDNVGNVCMDGEWSVVRRRGTITLVCFFSPSHGPP